MKICWYVPVSTTDYNKVPASVWIRCYQLIPFLKLNDIESVINNENEDVDFAIFVRWQNDSALEIAKRCKMRGQKIILDLCINYFDVTGVLGEGYGALEKHRDELMKMVEISDAIFCASSYIRDRASSFSENAYYLSDSINLDDFPKVKSLESFDDKHLSFVYSGVSSKTNFLFSSVYDSIIKNRFKLRAIMEKRSPFFKRYTFLKWSYENFANNLLSGHVGLAPRETENSYDKGHSIFKIGVYLASGLPILASPVPSYREIMDKNEVGLLCETTEDWEEAFIKIKETPEILKKWSGNCRKSIIPFSTVSISNNYARILDQFKK